MGTLAKVGPNSLCSLTVSHKGVMYNVIFSKLISVEARCEKISSSYSYYIIGRFLLWLGSRIFTFRNVSRDFSHHRANLIDLFPLFIVLT